jgi:hypothetical protein
LERLSINYGLILSKALSLQDGRIENGTLKKRFEIGMGIKGETTDNFL